MKRFFALLALGGVAANPVTKVLELIKELQAKIEADGVAEQKTYDKFACWCENTTERKAKAIHAAKKKISSLGNAVLTLKGEVATLGAEIADLTKRLAQNEENQAKRTAAREAQAADFQQEKAEIEQTMNALERAIKVLSGAGTGAKSLLAVKSTISQALSVSALDAKAQDLVSAFLEQGYSPQSETIQGILKDMYATFATTLEANTKDEMQSTANYEKLMAALQEEHATMTASKTKKEVQKADKEQTLADTSQQLEDTTNQMNEDAEFFDQTKKNCKNKSDEWDERHRLRAEELSGISEALKILDTEDARKLFSGTIKAGFEKSFVQVREERSSPNAKAYRALQHAASESHSLRLAALAAKVKKSGHFDVVMKAIDDMVAELDNEEADDNATRDECIAKTHKKKERKAVLVHKIERNVAKITKLTTKLEKTIESIEAATAAKKQEKEDLAEMTQNRADEHDAHKASKADDEAAIDLLERATAKLSSYNDANAIDAGPIEGTGRAAFVQQEPEFEVSEDQAPDTQFSGKDDNAQEGKGIVSILTMLTEDLRLEVSNGVKAEMAAQTAFEEARAASNKKIASLKEQITNLEGVKSNTQDAIDTEEQTKTDNEGLRDDKQGELDAIKPGCDWIRENMDKRRDFRAAEREGLTTAKSILAGAQASLLAKKSRVTKTQLFDDSVLPSLSFRGNPAFLARN